MATNNRIFYACQAVMVSGETVQGAQSVSVQSNFNLEQAFQLGKLAIYDNAVNTPEVNCTISKVLDGEKSIYNLATGGGTLVSNASDTCDVKLAIGDDTNSTISSKQEIVMSGMFLSSVSYTIPTDGFATEECSFLGDNKIFNTTSSVNAPTADQNVVLRRQHYDSTGSDLPSEVSGQNITNISISADLGREAMYKLGEFGPFHRFVNFPLEVSCEFEVSSTGLDEVEVTQDVDCTGSLLTEQPILIKLCDPASGATSYSFDLGSGNVLASVNYQGGDSGGGNATTTFSYTGYNELDISG